jgi:hypothetical protein
MPLPDPRELSLLLQGGWSLPVTEHHSATVSFLPMGEFWWVVAANSVGEKLRQGFLGNQWHGDWAVLTERRANTVPEVVRRKARKFGRAVSARAAAPPPEVERGLFLRLNFMEVPKSILNIPIPVAFGRARAGAGGRNHVAQIRIGDVVALVLQLFQTGDYRVLACGPNEVRLGPCAGGPTQVWRRSGVLAAAHG